MMLLQLYIRIPKQIFGVMGSVENASPECFALDCMYYYVRIT